MEPGKPPRVRLLGALEALGAVELILHGVFGTALLGGLFLALWQLALGTGSTAWQAVAIILALVVAGTLIRDLSRRKYGIVTKSFATLWWCVTLVVALFLDCT